MSQALCLVDRASHAGSFRCVSYERCLYRVFSSPFSRGRGIVQCSPSLCIVRCSFSPASCRLSTPTPRPSYRTPLPSPFFLLLGTQPPSLLPRRAHRLIFSPLFSIRSLALGGHHGHVYPHSMNRLCTVFMPPPLSVCYTPPPFTL